MSSPNPLQPQGVLDGAASPKSRVRITVLTILALHVLFIGGLLLQGCDKGSPTAAGSATTNAPSTLPSLTDTNYFSSFPGDPVPASSTSVTSTPGLPADPYSGSPTVTDISNSSPTVTPGFVPSGVPSSLPTVPATVSTPAVPIGAATEHVIKRGDIIGTLAKQYGVTVQAILDANPGVKVRNLKINDKLVIPAPTPAASSSAARSASDRTLAAAEPLPPGAEAYLVKKGDNLTTIARKFGVTVRQLRDANSLRSDRLVPQQRLIIPPKAPPATAPERAAQPPTL